MKGKLNRVTPEMCTKEELVAYVRECVRIWNHTGTAHITQSLDYFIRNRRMNEIYRELTRNNDEKSALIRAYKQVVAPFQGKKLRDVPEDVQKKIIDLSVKIDALEKEEKKLNRKLDKI